jgi:DGQHR domain-containing protein
MSNIEIPCITAVQGNTELVCFTMKAKDLWNIVEINKRDPDKDRGYQRVLSMSRVEAIAKYLDGGRVIPTCVLVTLDKPVRLSGNKSKLILPRKKRIGWVIDGQHRLAGAKHAATDVEFFVIAFIDLSVAEQVRQFVTINNESKGVPTSLIYDLLSYMPPDKSISEIAKEQSVEIANTLRKDETSPFYGRIAVITSPRKGELSLTNFVRKVAPLILKDKGKFNKYSMEQQRKIIDNFYKALIHAFPDQADPVSSVFFQTIGFGAMFNTIDSIFDYTMKIQKGFQVSDIIKTLKHVDDFDFDELKRYGTGNSAEIQAGNDFRVTLDIRMAEVEGGKDGRIKL